MISEEDARALIEEHMRKQGWDVTDFTILRRAVSVDEGEADYVIYHDGAPAAIIEAKKLGRIWTLHWSRLKVMQERSKHFLFIPLMDMIGSSRICEQELYHNPSLLFQLQQNLRYSLSQNPPDFSAILDRISRHQSHR
jgi:Type I restriction enzyme R protein N terminus (HSDR_N).